MIKRGSFPGVKQAGNNTRLCIVSRIRMSGATPLSPCADTHELNATFTLRKVLFRSELSIDKFNYTECPRGECARLRENVPYVKVHRYNPKHIYPKLNGYGDNGERKVWSSCGSTYCTCFACCYPYTAHVRP